MISIQNTQLVSRSSSSTLHSRGANFIDGGAGDGVEQASTKGRLPCWGLAEVGAEDVAHEHLLHERRVDLRPLESTCDLGGTTHDAAIG